MTAIFPEIPEQGDPAKLSCQANQRGMARLAAVQALYQMELAQTDISDIFRQFSDSLIGKEIDDDTYLPADANWFRLITNGVLEYQKWLDQMISDALTESWPITRIDATLRAILRAGGFELAKRPDVPVRVILDEYIEVAKAFYGEAETQFVNGVLAHLAGRLRADEMAENPSEDGPSTT